MTKGRREAAWINVKETRVNQGTPFVRNRQRPLFCSYRGCVLGLAPQNGKLGVRLRGLALRPFAGPLRQTPSLPFCDRSPKTPPLSNISRRGFLG